MKSPCKECLKYAICVSKIDINCELLYNYGRAYTDTDKEFWRLIYKIMPNCKSVSKDGIIAISSRPRYQGSGGITG